MNSLKKDSKINLKKDWKPKPLMYREVECRPSEIKQKIAEFRAEGFTLDSMEFEPSMYKYKLYYYHNSNTVKSVKDHVEEWRDLPGDLTGIYQMSSLGRLRTIKTRVLSEYRGATQVVDKNNKRKTIRLKNLFKQVFPEINI